MWEFESAVGEIIQRTPTIRSFRFPIRAKGVRYRSGQFFFVTIRWDGGEGVHHFSFSSSPTEKGYLEFTKRITHRNACFTSLALRGWCGRWRTSSTLSVYPIIR